MGRKYAGEVILTWGNLQSCIHRSSGMYAVQAEMEEIFGHNNIQVKVFLVKTIDSPPSPPGWTDLGVGYNQHIFSSIYVVM